MRKLSAICTAQGKTIGQTDLTLTDLKELLGREVDLVQEGALKP